MACRRSLEQLFFAPTDARIYTLLRVVLAGVSLVNWFCLLPYVDQMFLEVGGFPRHTPLASRPYSVFYYLSDSWIAVSFWVVPVLILGLVWGGRLARPSLVTLWLWTLSYNNYSRLHTVGWDVVLRAVLFLLVFAPLGSPLLRSSLLRPWRGSSSPATTPRYPPTTAPRYGLLLVQIQVALIYLATAWHKLPAAEWRDGTVMIYFFASHHSTVAGPWVADWPLTLALVTYATLLIEMALPFLLWKKSTRPWGLLLGGALHLGIAITSDLLLFSIVILSTYVAFLDGDDLDRALARLSWRRRDIASEPRAA